MPTVMRSKPAAREANGPVPITGPGDDTEYLDIPAFLRRQAD